MYADTRAAWTGTLPDLPGTAIRIEAAAWQGKPVSWDILVPAWSDYSTAVVPSVQIPPGIGNNTAGILIACIILLPLGAGPAFFARRNLRMGRGDRNRAARLSVFVVSVFVVAWLFEEHHVAATAELELFAQSAAACLLITGWFWLTYIALEPFVRRRWPGVLVGWSRLLARKYRDPLVGRDLLVGCLAGVVFILLDRNLVIIAHSILGSPPPRSLETAMIGLSGPHAVVAGKPVRGYLLWPWGNRQKLRLVR
jgi:hypothetical protein